MRSPVLPLLLVAAAVASPLLNRRPGPPGPRPTEARPALGQSLAAGLLFHLPLDLNRATLDDLMALPGIGPKRARAIIEKRRNDGRFSDVADARVPGLGPRGLLRIRPQVEVPP